MKSTLDFHPKFLASLASYSKEKFTKDLMAGIIVGIVALPLAIAFGIASGVSPEKGLITAIIGGFIVSFLGGNSVQISLSSFPTPLSWDLPAVSRLPFSPHR